MGLDNYFERRKPREDEEIVWPNVLLVQGMLAANPGWFRGRVYYKFVEQVTGEPLYQQIISEQKVSAMADRFSALIDSFSLLLRGQEEAFATTALPWFLDNETKHSDRSSEEWLKDYTLAQPSCEISQEEVLDLARLFRFAAKERMILRGWW